MISNSSPSKTSSCSDANLSSTSSSNAAASQSFTRLVEGISHLSISRIANSYSQHAEQSSSSTSTQGDDNILPYELLRQIFGSLSIKDLAPCSLVSRQWRAIIKEIVIEMVKSNPDILLNADLKKASILATLKQNSTQAPSTENVFELSSRSNSVEQSLNECAGLDLLLFVAIEILAEDVTLLGDPRNQNAFLDRALPILTRLYGINHFKVARAHVDAAAAFYSLDQIRNCTMVLENNSTLIDVHYGNEHADRIIGSLGITFHDFKRDIEYKKLFGNLDKSYRSLSNAKDSEVTTALRNLGAIYDSDKVDELSTSALAFRE